MVKSRIGHIALLASWRLYVSQTVVHVSHHKDRWGGGHDAHLERLALLLGAVVDVHKVQGLDLCHARVIG
jgi:hypothetical protein